MIEKIIEFSFKKKFFVILVFFFISVWGVFILRKVPIDAIPDLSDPQVILFAEWAGQSPQTVEDQITYPVVSKLFSAPKVKSVRGFSYFGLSIVYVIFEDGVDLYWARSRVVEYIQGIELPEGVEFRLGPDATGVGWGLQYALVDEDEKCDLSCLRTLNDWYVKFVLRSVQGVADVESVGGFEKQYQIIVDPIRIAAYGLSLSQIIDSVRNSNSEVGGRILELSQREYFIRGRGYIKDIKEIENTTVGFYDGVPVYLKDVADVVLGPEIRRGVADLDGRGDVVGGIVIVRFGENMYDVIKRVKDKIEEIRNTIPAKILIVYDRSDLIRRVIDHLKDKLTEEIIFVLIVCGIFLLHIGGALVITICLPVAVLMSFIAMYHLGIVSNIMSLSGIAIAIGTMVDAMIILVENVSKRLEKEPSKSDLILQAMKEVGVPIFFTLLVITVSFLPVFALEAQEGRLFKPLAYTKTLAMLFSAVVAITLAPALVAIFIRGKVLPEEKNPVSFFLMRIYEPALRFCLRYKFAPILISVLLLIFGILSFRKLGKEFMPSFNEGTLLYMPTTLPGISITEISRIMQIQDRIIKSFPEVLTVFGKAGRAETPTDPAPLSMIETTIILKPEDQWPCRVTNTGIKSLFEKCRRWNIQELISHLDYSLRMPGVVNSWGFPIRIRIDMLTTGIRTPLGIKVFGSDIYEVERLAKNIENVLKRVYGTRSVYAETVEGGYYLDIEIKRDKLGLYGLSIQDVQNIVSFALGGYTITKTVEARERYSVQIRYARDFRDDPEDISRILIPAGDSFVMLSDVAEIRFTEGPSFLKNENGFLTLWIYIDVDDSLVSLGEYVSTADKLIKSNVQIPSGYSYQWSGQYEYIKRVDEKLKFLIPMTLFLVFVLIYINTGSFFKTFFVFLAVPFSVAGSFIFLYLLDYNLSIAVWVGIIALAGLDAETGVIMLLYLDLAYEKWKKEGRLNSSADLIDSIDFGAVKRLRPKAMTALTIIFGLIPIMWSEGTGAEIMKRVSAPLLGGIITSFLVELFLYPVIFYLWKKKGLK
ncbi:MAG: CusA/CzcA family heavy metal efflux RND transporter [Candidatus Calescibacterium sp.]|nr:CusA/CzcA family heavy metal efflux RND transporter [Candidatus Calescibacterium sp.]MDW8088057.1 CusA/CzcA family heavy metal efflux RND transporter [Candidatus Calescibacterium sp.]